MSDDRDPSKSFFDEFFGPEARKHDELIRQRRLQQEGERNYTNPDQILMWIDHALSGRVKGNVPANSTKPNQLVRLITLHNGKQLWLTLEERDDN